MIYGLEDDYYCVHTPIPVEVYWESPNEWARMQIFRYDPVLNEYLLLDGDGEYILVGHDGLTPRVAVFNEDFEETPQLGSEPILYRAADGRYKVDLSKWLKPFMRKFGYILEYKEDLHMFMMNDTQFRIVFTNNNEDSQNITKSFVHCSLYSGRLEDNDNPVPAWNCYPFSVTDIDGNILYALVVNGQNSLPDIDRDIDYISECCHGTYIKWLNEYGDYSYWLFKHTRVIETEGSEYFRTPRDIFNTDKSSNEDTVGFDVTEKMSVKSIVEKKYYHMFRSLVGSPEVYMLRSDYTLGSDVSHSDWVKIIQDDVTFERDYINRATAELEFDFSLPKVYSQKRI